MCKRFASSHSKKHSLKPDRLIPRLNSTCDERDTNTSLKTGFAQVGREDILFFAEDASRRLEGGERVRLARDVSQHVDKVHLFVNV